jgi:hypothetical protein
MMVVTSTRWSVLAAGAYDVGFTLAEVTPALRPGLEELDKELLKISPQVGAPDLAQEGS